MNVNELAQIAGAAKELKPEIKELVDELLNSYGDMVYNLLERLSLASAQLTRTHYRNLIDQGFTSEEAFQLTTLKVQQVKEAASKCQAAK